MKYAVPPAARSTLRVVISGNDELLFPVRRVYCIGRNYYDHAVEMEARHRALGLDDTKAREAPFFFQKPCEAVVDTSVRNVRYPPGTSQLEFECEMVVGLTSTGVGYYGVGCDLTRRDLQNEAKAKRRPWEAAKSFDDSAPCGPLVAAEGLPKDAVMQLAKNGEICQKTALDLMIFDVPEALRQLSNEVALQAGDILFTGTPAGVGRCEPGDRIECTITKDGRDLVPPCSFTILEPTAMTSS
ncbi:hypothetical protein CTAYLR_001654 [Chrysophaeum taylorii]|uniref:Fumarylacetoacetase-like C-terminal domain-containing protein n=1 Tax=Chrysophaeum taylorii TaxID=2483200 RepID=A0AAD7UCA2_9STRA|nr:hypothetical protein CTAYLR_001654 [Chrysophaeum taylorii]